MRRAAPGATVNTEAKAVPEERATKLSPSTESDSGWPSRTKRSESTQPSESEPLRIVGSTDCP